MDRQNKIGPIDRLSQEREYYMAKNCEQLYIYLNRNSGKMNDNDQLFLLRVMIEEKHCEDQRLVPFLEKLLTKLIYKK